MNSLPLFDLPFLAAAWADDFKLYVDSGKDAQLLDRLTKWAARVQLKEMSSSAPFIKHFFHDIWQYALQGDHADGTYNCHPEFPVAGAGQTGGKGEADLALGHFRPVSRPPPQVLCEFKDIKSGLDAQQNRKGNSRSPVRQAWAYLHESRERLTGNELVEPQWAIVTDMNEFRLYYWSKGLAQSQRFVITSKTDPSQTLTWTGESGVFERFLFWKLFSPEMLLAEKGPSQLARLLKTQITHEQDIEEGFYRDYKAYREHLYRTIAVSNPDFPGTKGKLVRLTQRFLDRCLFLLFCEDMGKALQFPPNLYRDELIAYSQGSLYGPDDTFPWDRLKSIFRAMNKGGAVGKHTISRFNGGLFESMSELEDLHIPAFLFCAENQGEDAVTLLAKPLTLLYFSAKYNFGIKTAHAGRVIDFYALGRIFEQSITELEIMEAEADGRDSLNLLTKRKRDGVYYTPEWVTAYVVEETVGARLADIKRGLGLGIENRPEESDLELYLASLKDKRRAAPKAGAWLEALRQYRVRLGRVRVVDPACGSGAFLIQALEFLKAEYRWIIDESERITRQSEIWDADVVVNSILTKNLYGVDINAESVEIAKLALWMHTASPGKPLSSLDANIQCGNSLVGTDFYRLNQLSLFSEDDKDRINAFDWREAFPTVFSEGGFDCVVGNPPYVKLQHFRRVQAKVAAYLTDAKRPDGRRLYASTQTGNFDLYLPFIEQGLEVLHPEGRMGYIAPNVWMVNDYGEGLRSLMRHGRKLDRWVDFKSFQVFDEAITYTALQFFTGASNDAIKCAFAPDGDLVRVNWVKPDARIPYAELPADDSWNLMADSARALVNRLKAECLPLGAPTWTSHIFQGLITSADGIYHLTRTEDGRFRTSAGQILAIEPALMHALVSGPEAKRYQAPKTDTYVLFPYKLDAGRPALFTPAEMAEQFPNGWAYLRQHETALRQRESRAFDDAEWYRFGRNQNIDKQEFAKLLVPRLVERLFCVLDSAGQFFLDNVDVGGILASTTEDLAYLCGILNAPVANFVWRQISKPFQNNYYSANKQFIAPLPIPHATLDERRQIGAYANQLQQLHTERRDLVEKFSRRLNSTQTFDDSHGEDWLWADVHTIDYWKSKAEPGLLPKQRTAWAKAQYQAKLDGHLIDLDARLKRGATVVVEDTADELRLRINGIAAIELFDKPGTPLIASQWRQAVRGIRVTDAFNGRKLINLLMNLRQTRDEALAQSLVAIDRELVLLDASIASNEAKLNALTYQLYGLNRAEIALVES